MSDPLSIAGLVLAVGSVAQGVLSYAMAVKEAGRDISQLLTELLALKGFLEQIQSDKQSQAAYFETTEYYELLQTGFQVVRSLELDLNRPVTKIGSVVSRLKWPLKKEDARKHFERLERVKSYFLLVMVRLNA